MGMNCYIYHTKASLYTQSYVQETIQICTELSGTGRDTTILTSGNTLHNKDEVSVQQLQWKAG